MRFSRKTALLVLLACPLAAPANAQTAYKYRDANGQWVFTDQPNASAAPTETLNLGHESTALHIAIDRNDAGDATQLIAVNDCLCVVTFQVTIVNSGFAAIPDGAQYKALLQPLALGSPDAIHNASAPYRVPFGVGSTFLVSQAYPSRITHTTADSQYAIDFALPDGTPVYAAREGTVINARHDFFRGATAPVMLDQANVIEILHSDGTIGLYAHLHWDSIRVRIGEHVARGQYIADSGNTGFTSGPHLHFAVIRNAGVENVSIPVQFAGIAGVAVTPVNQTGLTAY